MTIIVNLMTTADVVVNTVSYTRNYNTYGLGFGKSGNYLYRSLLKFDLRNLSIAPGAITSAKLMLYGRTYGVSVGTPVLVAAYYTEGSWDEKTVTWMNQPTPTSYLGKILMGSTSQVPRQEEGAAEAWFSVPIDLDFIKHAVGGIIGAILKGREDITGSYAYAYDKEGMSGSGMPLTAIYAPYLLIEGEPAAVIKLDGKCMGGYPKPSMLLEIYMDGVRLSQRAITSDLLVTGQAYSLEVTTTTPGIHTVYGRMVLTNPLGSYEFLTPTEYVIFGLGFTVHAINAMTAAPVSGALVTMYCVSGVWAGKTLTGTTGADGTVDFYPFESGIYNLTVTKAGFKTYSYPNMNCGPGGGFYAGLIPS